MSSLFIKHASLTWNPAFFVFIFWVRGQNALHLFCLYHPNFQSLLLRDRGPESWRLKYEVCGKVLLNLYSKKGFTISKASSVRKSDTRNGQSLQARLTEQELHTWSKQFIPPLVLLNKSIAEGFFMCSSTCLCLLSIVYPVLWYTKSGYRPLVTITFM